jgi:glyoxylase-like metal-dependent hydrolase (beta-lactamase superfamily II)
MSDAIEIQAFFDEATNTVSYLVADPATGRAAIIDPVLDYDQRTGEASTASADAILAAIAAKSLTVDWVLETHAHADHLSSSQILKQIFPEAILGIGEKIKAVQETFKNHFNIDYLKTTGEQFDHLFKNFEEINFGSLHMKAIPTPGHTPACMSYQFGDAVFVGDAIFMPDYGTGRCDFPGGSAHDLYQSVFKNLYSLPDSTRVFVGHDYSPGGREMRFETTIGESKKQNIQLTSHTSEKEFITFREARDKTLSAPRLLLPSIQINIEAGHLPKTESNGKSYLKLPLNPILKSGIL